MTDENRVINKEANVDDQTYELLYHLSLKNIFNGQ